MAYGTKKAMRKKLGDDLESATEALVKAGLPQRTALQVAGSIDGKFTVWNAIDGYTRLNRAYENRFLFVTRLHSQSPRYTIGREQNRIAASR